MVIDDFWRPFIRHTPIPFLLDLAPAGAALLQAGGLHHLTARRVLRDVLPPDCDRGLAGQETGNNWL